MALEFSCPKCGDKVTLKFLKVGEKGQCPSCQVEITVPADALRTGETEVPEPKKEDIIMKIRAGRLSGGSLFKLLLIGISLSMGPFVLLCGILSIFGAGTIKVNDEPVTGIVGLIASIIMVPIFSIIFTCMSWLGIAFGLWLYSKFRKIEISFKDAEVLS